MFKSCVWGLRIAIERENMPLKKWPPSERTPDRQGCRRHMDRASFTLTTGIQLLNWRQVQVLDLQDAQIAALPGCKRSSCLCAETFRFVRRHIEALSGLAFISKYMKQGSKSLERLGLKRRLHAISTDYTHANRNNKLDSWIPDRLKSKPAITIQTSQWPIWRTQSLSTDRTEEWSSVYPKVQFKKEDLGCQA